MKTPKEQNLIAQVLISIERNIDLANYNIVGYEFDGDYRIAISPNYGMISQAYIALVLELSQAYGFHFYISDTCTAASHDQKLFMIIY